MCGGQGILPIFFPAPPLRDPLVKSGIPSRSGFRAPSDFSEGDRPFLPAPSGNLPTRFVQTTRSRGFEGIPFRDTARDLGSPRRVGLSGKTIGAPVATEYDRRFLCVSGGGAAPWWFRRRTKRRWSGRWGGSASRSSSWSERAVHELLEGDLAALDGSVSGSDRVVGYLPACRLEHLGDPAFCAEHRLRYPYMSGAMANGIGSVEIVEAMGRAGMLGFFGAAGLPLAAVEAAIDRLERSLGRRVPYGFNLIHSPNEPDLEAAVVDLYLRRGVRLVEASAYLDLTLPVVRYRVHGIHRDACGPGRRAEPGHRQGVAGRGGLEVPGAAAGEVSSASWSPRARSPPEQAELGRADPVAEDVTAEADSGGHTDNRPAIVLLPTMLALRDRLQAQYRLRAPAADRRGGRHLDARSAAAAFAMGAAYVVTGSVNQACVESGTSDAVRRDARRRREQADVAMAPAADMFEMGVKVQVLKRGTMFAMRAAKLYELYRACDEPRRDPRRRPRRCWRRTSSAPRSTTIWDQTRDFFREPRPGAGRAGRARARSTRWPWCSAGISACRRAGPTPASRRGRSITRSGAARRWARSTSGSAARSWNSPRTAGSSRWR